MLVTGLVWKYMLKPSTVYDAADDDFSTLANDEMLVLLGGFMFVSVFPMGMPSCIELV
jgi:hypothetical protein